MSTAFRSIAKHSRTLSRSGTAILNSTRIRKFHTPFSTLGNSPTTQPPPPASTISAIYEKQFDHPLEPLPPHSGPRTYVVSEPDPADFHYAVPSGAYPTSSPYVNFTPTEAPDTQGEQSDSSSLARPQVNLAGRNPPPDGDVAEKFSKLGNDKAWKERK